MRVTIDQDPFLPLNMDQPWYRRGLWPAAWVACPGAVQPPFVTAYRLRFTQPEAAVVRVHAAADERYDLYLDGAWIGRGNERGAPDMWFYETYDLPLEPGEHMLVARVWSLGDSAAQAQMSVHPGFLLAAEGAGLERLSTGLAPWEAKILDGYTFLPPGPAHWRGARIQVNGAAFSWGYEHGEGPGWLPVEVVKPGMGRLSFWEFHRHHLLRPATLPVLLNRPFRSGNARFVGQAGSPETQEVAVSSARHMPGEASGWTAMLCGAGTVQVPANTTRRVLLDLEEYLVAFPEIVTTGGAGSMVRVHWAESLFSQPDPRSHKGNRSEVEGKFFTGYGDTFLPDGGSRRKFDALWWMAGRYVELYVQTAGQPLTIESLNLYEYRYPLELESRFSCDNPRLNDVIPILVRGMQMCANETYFDCPYYEELMYAGDTRLEILTTYVMTRDDRLPRKAIRMFDSARLASGLTQSRYPTRVPQIISTFALWWVMMFRDYIFWRNDPEFVCSILPGMRATLEGFERFLGDDGLLYGPEGWNTLDWVPEWDQDAGVPPAGHSGASGVMNVQLVYALLQGAEVEDAVGDPRFASIFRERAQNLMQVVVERFWDEGRGLLADDLHHSRFSEHAQCLALLSDGLAPGLLNPAKRARIAEGLLEDEDLARTTIYFNFYLFETYRLLGCIDSLLERMSLWFGLQEQGLKTTVEMPEPTRSDCHGWGAHPLYHYFATLLGIHPAAPGFRQVEIAPQLGPLHEAQGTLVHPDGGEIQVALRQDQGRLHGTIRLPTGLTGWLAIDGRKVELKEGEYTF